MATRLFVGNINHHATENDIQDHFNAVGKVVSVDIILDRTTGKPRGFGFVEMSNPDEAKKAIENFHNKEFQGRPLTVNEARPREARPPQERAAYGGGYRDRR